jgi:hypothetical protein
MLLAPCSKQPSGRGSHELERGFKIPFFFVLPAGFSFPNTLRFAPLNQLVGSDYSEAFLCFAIRNTSFCPSRHNLSPILYSHHLILSPRTPAWQAISERDLVTSHTHKIKPSLGASDCSTANWLHLGGQVTPHLKQGTSEPKRAH